MKILTKKEMWYSRLEHHLSGIDDPNYCGLGFTTNKYNYFVYGDEDKVYFCWM